MAFNNCAEYAHLFSSAYFIHILKKKPVVVIFQWHLMTKEDNLLCFIVYMYKFVMETISCRQALNKFDSNVLNSATDPLVLHNPLCQIISKYPNA